MGKKQHQKDKLYLTTTEWKEFYGGHKETEILLASQAKFKRLPFGHCSLSLLPCENPYCSPGGEVFDLVYILPYLRKYGKNPVSGEPLDVKSLFKLNFYKNKEGEYHCPVTYRVFTNNSHIVTVRPTGNVYSYDAVEELNLKTKHLKDLLTDEPFTKTDIITLQDPYNLEKFNIATFDHVKRRLFRLKREEDDDEKNGETSGGSQVLRSMNTETKETLAQLEKSYQPQKKKVEVKPKADSVNAASYSTGMVAAGFTSTVMEPLTEHEPAIIDEDSLRYARVKKKGYVRLMTNFGPLNLELFCDVAPRACENFIVHCKEGYYKNTLFHRLIRNFVVQGGDPTGTGKGGESIWHKAFADEFRQELSHSGRGVLSMANSGPNTNTSQFFLTFRSCKQLDRKHTIFGKLVGGFETLNLIEGVEVDEQDRPVVKVEIIDTPVYLDPFEEAAESIQKEREKLREEEELKQKQRASVENKGPKVYKRGVGKYLNPVLLKKTKEADASEEASETAVKKRKGNQAGFCDFSSW